MWSKSNRLTILCYHRVSTNPTANHYYTLGISTAQFRDQMRYIRRYYKPAPLEDALERLAAGILPSGSVAVTFDDGYSELASEAFPVLQELGIPATVFLIAGHVGTGKPFWWEEAAHRLNILSEQDATTALRASGLPFSSIGNDWRSRIIRCLKRALPDVRDACMSAVRDITGRLRVERMSLNWDEVYDARSRGIAFGSHSINHPVLTSLDQASLEFELRKSREIIETMTNTPCRILAYPNGDHDERVRAAAVETGYCWAVTMERGRNGLSDNRFALKRQPVYSYHKRYAFAALLGGWLDLPYRFAHTVRRLQSADD
jgi:peptidoglycan/xylan/chitin deacetylase (PgdA/CDA1 family)